MSNQPTFTFQTFNDAPEQAEAKQKIVEELCERLRACDGLIMSVRRGNLVQSTVLVAGAVEARVLMDDLVVSLTQAMHASRETRPTGATLN